VSAFQYAGAIILVFSLLFLFIGGLQRKGLVRFRLPLSGASAARKMEIVERLPLTAQHSLHLVRIDGECLLLGVSPSGIALLKNAKENS